MKVIGIAGGVASGKSVVARHLSGLGAFVFDADAIAHDVLREPAIIASAKTRWGDAVIGEEGQIDRAAIAERVFGTSDQACRDLLYWERCTHPRITELVSSELVRLRASGKYQVVVLDAPLLFKAGWDQMCDQVLFVDADPETRWQRAESRGWTKVQFKNREASQLSVNEKRRRSSIVIDNSGTMEQTYEQVLRFWNSLSD